MPEHRRVVAILAYNDFPIPSMADFTELMVARRDSLKRYWEDNAAGVIVFDRFDLVGPFPVVLSRLSKEYGPESPRWTSIGLARDSAAANGVDLDLYDTTIVMLHPATSTWGGLTLPYDVGGTGPPGTTCLLPYTETGTYFAHEIGHALGFVHSHGIRNLGGDWEKKGILSSVYGDPYGLMSAQSFGGSDPTMSAPSDFTGYPSARGIGPMLARAELFRDKADAVQEAGLVLPLEEVGTTTATVFAAGLGGPGRPEVAAYRTTGGSTILVELRKPGRVEDRNWWDGGLEEGVDNQRDAPGVVVHCLKTPQDEDALVAFYTARLAMPGPDTDTTFDVPDGRFTLRVADPQRAVPDSITFSLQRGAREQTLLVHEDAVVTSTLVSSEQRPHPRYPGHYFTWEVREVTRTVTYVPRAGGIGLGWPELTKDREFNVEIAWGTDTLDLRTPLEGSAAGLTWSVDPVTGVLTLYNDPAAGTLSLRVYATAYDTDYPRSQSSRGVFQTTYDVEGRAEGWGADFITYVTGLLAELVHRSVPVFPQDPGEVDDLVAQMKDTWLLLRDDRPDLAARLAPAVLRRERQLQDRTSLSERLQVQRPDVDLAQRERFHF